MEETKNLWKKTAAELTVGETMTVTMLTPIVMIGSMAALVTVAVAISEIKDKIHEMKMHRRNKNRY